MANCNKINSIQKNKLAKYMKEHPRLAKNMLPNTSLGKATSIRLWEVLTNMLNAAGPPIKNAKMWRKAFADQKFQVKKKLAFNKASKNKPDGCPYAEKVLTEADEQIIEASGLGEEVDECSLNSNINLELPEENMKPASEFNKRLEAKFDRFIQIQERILQMKEEKHKSYMDVQNVELRIKSLELERIKKEIVSD